MQTLSPMPWKRSRGAQKLLVLSIVTLLGIPAIRSLLPPSPSHPYPLLAAAGWAGRPKSLFRPYQWLLNGDVAHLEQVDQGRLQVCYQQADLHGPHGAIRRGPILPKPFSENLFFAPSPDEQWVAYWQRLPGKKFQTVLLSANGKQSLTFSNAGFARWLPDHRSFITCSTNASRSLTVHHLGSDRTETIVGLTPYQDPYPLSDQATGSDFLIGGAFAHLSSLTDSTPNYPVMTVRAYSLAQPNVVQRAWNVPVPSEMSDGEAFVSPDRKHLLWVTDGFVISPLRQWMDSRMPSWATSSRHFGQERRYFLSDLEGHDRHPILMDLALRSGIELFPSWTPDSKHLSFIKNNRLYLVSVE